MPWLWNTLVSTLPSCKSCYFLQKMYFWEKMMFSFERNKFYSKLSNSSKELLIINLPITQLNILHVEAV